MENYNFYGCDTVSLAKEFGTPLYVMSEDCIVSQIQEIKDAFDNKYKNCSTYFASKSFLTKDMVRICKENNIGIDVVSGGELYVCKCLDFPPEKIMFHGNSKTYEEIEMGIDYNVARFVCDSIEEIQLINEIASKKNATVKILIRVTPGVDSHTHKYISTAAIDSKFGIPLQNMMYAINLSMNLPNIELTGFHFHVGSQLLENDSHLMAVKILLDTIKQAKDELGFVTKDFDLGGGFGIHYTKDDIVKPVSYFIDGMFNIISDFCKNNNILMPHLMVEPGRWIVGEAGITLYTIGSIKEIPNICTYVGVDGGFPDNPRHALYQAVYEAVVCNKVNEEKTETVTIAGKCCETGDILITDLKVPKLLRGDILAVKSTGAYNYSMASNYNKTPIPALVMIKDGVVRLSVKRQTFEDLYSRDI